MVERLTFYPDAIYRSWRNQDYSCFGRHFHFEDFKRTDMYIWHGISSGVEKKLASNIKKWQYAGYAFTYKVFTNIGHGGLAAEHPEQFLEEVISAHENSLKKLVIGRNKNRLGKRQKAAEVLNWKGRLFMDKIVDKYAGLFRSALKGKHFPEIDRKVSQYRCRLAKMYSSDAYREHNAYPTMNVEKIYAVIAMCLELKEYEPSLSDHEIIDFVNGIFEKKRRFLKALGKCVNLLPNSYQIARKWNISDHEKRVRDGSITYDYFHVMDGKIEYRISGCMYIEMFQYYGIRNLCKIFCMTDEFAYSMLPKHVRFIRHSDLSDGDSCHDEIWKSLALSRDNKNDIDKGKKVMLWNRKRYGAMR